MINTLYYAIGFLIYVWYSTYTFDVYSKKEGFTKFFIFIMIYFYYTFLAGYIINFVDYNALLIEKVVQISIYAIIGGIIIYTHYKLIISNKNKDLYN